MRALNEGELPCTTNLDYKNTNLFVICWADLEKNLCNVVFDISLWMNSRTSKCTFDDMRYSSEDLIIYELYLQLRI